mmetsp:Transcript_129075/g.287658  ORF Transcript_129075/g.287658 Transcript_129075/m.287658 type:complete len:256 (+) Transcript_129075:76-843(+)
MKPRSIGAEAWRWIPGFLSTLPLLLLLLLLAVLPRALLLALLVPLLQAVLASSWPPRHPCNGERPVRTLPLHVRPLSPPKLLQLALLLLLLLLQTSVMPKTMHSRALRNASVSSSNFGLELSLGRLRGVAAPLQALLPSPLDGEAVRCTSGTGARGGRQGGIGAGVVAATAATVARGRIGTLVGLRRGGDASAPDCMALRMCGPGKACSSFLEPILSRSLEAPETSLSSAMPLAKCKRCTSSAVTAPSAFRSMRL